MKQLITLAVVLILMSCNGISTARQMSPDSNNTDNTSSLLQQMNITPNDSLVLANKIAIGSNPLFRDSIFPAPGILLNKDQRSQLGRQSGLEMTDSVQFIGVRSIDKTLTMAAYLVPLGEDPNHFKVYLMTHGKDGTVVDALDLHEFHTTDHQMPLRFGGNRFYTTDATVIFDDTHHFIVHRVMTFTSLFLKNHQLTELWRVEWDNDYEITADGHFKFNGQHETSRTNNPDEKMVDEYKSRDLNKVARQGEMMKSTKNQ